MKTKSKIKLLRLESIRTDGGTRAVNWEYVQEWQAYLQTGQLPSPPALFADVTFIRDSRQVKAIVQHCLTAGYIPGLDWCDSYKCFVFHTLSRFGEDRISQKTKLVNLIELEQKCQGQQAANERDLETLLTVALSTSGAAPRRQVICGAGRADVVTNDAIYEIKWDLRRSEIFFQAVGQLIVYQAFINPQARLYLVSRFEPSTRHKHVAATLGIEVILL